MSLKKLAESQIFENIQNPISVIQCGQCKKGCKLCENQDKCVQCFDQNAKDITCECKRGYFGINVYQIPDYYSENIKNQIINQWKNNMPIIYDPLYKKQILKNFQQQGLADQVCFKCHESCIKYNKNR
ncbi:hypothetical protein PPERSA_11096 [Pseudocohnilembus persalinus]|uniref:Insulin-like growth factor binding protein, N-terminal n=1 Tax=Pseudocohnilembus persalinus TaxID=266149 RepID=A0A0V0QZ86_PSEPJ|nr:hypothetical protein PPERSA_11096 [Pseudocohnilembus persalinus]|eukprot:KRX07547.1 hypothetical protein PPERSA_11096 [Pseudocohnilembus persalinus]